ncbi:uncharacterized protein LOC117319010 [Pecten maximus]|uniref:uncharacterized protein LOC117319010 n=1 Tax=Pecten maximus TaxID=6579 RepID=UPI00145892DC|nr:uncharacterized protein LOC117319010 [Pecten maximus]
MVKTKTTPRREHQCPMCRYQTIDMEKLKAHMVDCGLKQMSKQLRCPQCSFTTMRKNNLTRHDKKHIKDPITSLADESDPESQKARVDSDAESWKGADPGDLGSVIGYITSSEPSDEESGEDEEVKDPQAHVVSPQPDEPELIETVELGRTISKPTKPSQVFSPKRKNESCPTTVSAKYLAGTIPKKVAKVSKPAPNMREVKKKLAQHYAQTTQSAPKVGLMAGSTATITTRSTGVQTDPMMITLTRKTIRRFREGETEVEQTEVEEARPYCPTCVQLQ